ncbi:glycosyltransferase [Exiguobacterium sp. LL15]|uniref:glycosyltransferase family 2 protein n=1 Tax=Exiguobacterium sp. LL15 TaxID=2950547 RepID=UPI0021089394|nr:glycosyltransferase [Exiguobacterium sp. LL15]MCQ4091248.1 glycosyltransferase [Exiguobacterium sp. LL15]
MIGIAMSTYENEAIIMETIRSLQAQQASFLCVIADDGSTDSTVATMRQLTANDTRFEVLALPHGERGIARKTAIDRLKQHDVEFLYIIDSDMVLEEQLLKSCLLYLEAHVEVGALVIPERAYSDFDNYFSQVKVFERNLFNVPTDQLDTHTMEAARFWRLEAYVASGEIDPTQISFEETQPTIRYLEQGGIIRRATFTYVHHNEKQVELSDLLRKKRYYFDVMPATLDAEQGGFMKALRRWYFFRPVLYHQANLKKYSRHPLLTAGVIYMYLRLSFIGVESLFFKRVS